MTNLAADAPATWDPVYQLETTDPVVGGPGGLANAQAQALLNRTEFLKAELATIALTPGPQGIPGAASTVPGPQGIQGATGAPGTNGTNGANGTAATIEMGVTTTGAPGSAALATNAGSPGAVVLNLTIPQGLPGADAVAPSGAVIMFAGPTTPTGYLACDGSSVSRTIYPNLFAALETAWGAGDGSTTFNLPDLQGFFPFGASHLNPIGSSGGEATHTLALTEIPAHDHTFMQAQDLGPNTGGSGSNPFSASNATANTGMAGGGAAHNNMPPYVAIGFFIKT